jgi:predicted transcriptional regulator
MSPDRRSTRARGRRDAPDVVADVPELHELEAAVMDQMWRVDRATVREVLDALNDAGSRARAYTTVMTIMRRLDTKGLLRRERQDRTDVYTAVMSREDYTQARARKQVEALVDEFGDVALANFARQVERLEPGRLEALREMAGRTGSNSKGKK